MRKKNHFQSTLSAAFVITIIAGIAGLGFYRSVSAQTDELKAVADLLMLEAVAVEKGDLTALDKI